MLLLFMQAEVISILTYQDYEKEAVTDERKASFLLDAIREYQASDMYNDAVVAQNYYQKKNITILNRLTYLERSSTTRTRSRLKINRLCSGHFPKFVKQEAQYLLGNGVTLDEAIKSKLGAKFDKDLQRAGMQALVDAVNWGFWDVNRLKVFRATEFCPLLDEMTSNLKVGIRFFQLDENKPMYIELYELDGITKYKQESESGKLEVIAQKQAYKVKVFADNVSEIVTDTENYPEIPIFPLWGNELHQSEFTSGFRSLVDAFDAINSDLADGITQIEGVYWVLKNFGGDKVSELIEEIQELKAVYTDRSDSGAEPSVIEVPHQTKQVALELLEKQMYDDYMALDIKALTGGSLTNVAINVAKTDFDLKCDIFEWQCADFVENILRLIGVTDPVIEFKRRSITNDTEKIQNIYTYRDDIDHETALRLNPEIPDEMVEEILQRFEEEQAGMGYIDDEPNDDDGDPPEGGDVDG